MLAYSLVGAYVLIEIQDTDPLEVVTALRSLPEVRQAHAVLGPTDCIAYLECATHDDLRDAILRIRTITGVFRTDTRYVYR
jgi:DNA-binding Lrp family transcriptional regulator